MDQQHNQKKEKKMQTLTQSARTEARTIPPRQVAALIGVNVSTLHRWIKRGVFPRATVSVGRTVRWNLATVEKFISEGVRGVEA